MICVFEKSTRLRHVGHLDLMRTIQRCLRRSGLPVSYSKGFNPHLLLSFASPLSVGVPGLREVMEVPIDTEISEEEFRRKLSAALPPELPLVSVRAVDDRHPAPMALLLYASYDILPDDNADLLYAAIPAFMQRTSVMTMKKSKSGMKEVDIRPMIYNLTVKSDGHLHALLSLCEAATCKPELMLTELAKQACLDEAPHARIVRTALYGESFKPLEEL